MKFWILAAIAILATGCKSKEASMNTIAPTMALKSGAFRNGAPIPEKFSAYGQNVSPPLSWSGVPENAVELALIVDDPDAPSAKPFVHWVVYGITPKATEIQGGSAPKGASEGLNGRGTAGYFGPRPPSGNHRYYFRLYALDKPTGLKPGATREELDTAMSGHVLATGELMGTYAAP